jgi:hypothetical protein
MIKVNLVDPLDQWKNLGVLRLDTGGVVEAEMQLKSNEPHQLKMVINTNIGHLWDWLRENFEIGLKIKTNRLDLPFIKARQPQFDRANGVINLGFMSPLWRLNYSQRLNADREYRGSAYHLIAQLDPKLKWTLIGQDEEINISTGQKSNYDILKEVCSLIGWSFFDAGLGSGGNIPEVIVGQSNFFADGLAADPRFKKVFARQTNSLDNPFEPNQAVIKSLKRNYSGDVFTHFLPVGDTGNGTSLNASVRLGPEDVNADWVNSNYPIVPVPNSRTNTVDYYVFNAQGAQEVNEYRFTGDVFVLSSNSIDPNGSINRNQEDAKRYIYRQAVSFLQRKKLITSYSYDFVFREVVCPGTIINVKYKEIIRAIDGTEYKSFNLNEDFLLKEGNWNLLNITG